MAKTIAQLLATATLFALFGAADKPAEPPKLTEAQKLEIRNAQVDFFSTQSQLQSSPQYAAFQKAQRDLESIVQKVLKEVGADPKKFTLQPDLTFTAVPQPSPSPTPTPVPTPTPEVKK